MKKILLIASLCFLSLTNTVTAQDFNFTYSEGFPEQKEWSKLKLLSNGNTILINLGPDIEIYLSLFDKGGKTIVNNTIKPKYIGRRLKASEVQAVYEINHAIVLFLVDYIEGRSTLSRLIIDPNNATLKSEEIIATADSGTDNQKYGAYDDTRTYGFLLKKDPQSDYYAVLSCHSMNGTSNENFQIIHFSPEHKEINKASFSAPDKTFSSINYLSIHVKADQYVIMGSFLYNQEKEANSDKSKTYVSKLEKGSSSFIHTEIKEASTFQESHGRFEFDPLNNLLFLIIETKLASTRTRNYAFFLQPINPDALTLFPLFQLPTQKANEYFITNVEPNSKKGFQGMPQNYLIDQEGNHMVLFQNTILKSSSSSRQTFFNEIAITSFDKEGKEKYGFIIPCNYYLDGSHVQFTYYDGKKGYKPGLGWTGAGFPRYWLFHIDMVSSKNFNYIFMNNRDDNFENPDNIKKKQMMTLSSLTATYYKLQTNGELIKGYLFGKPSKTNAEQFCNFNSSDFNSSTGEYVTIVTQEIKGDKISKVVWFNLDK